MKSLDPAWRKRFVRHSNEIDPQPGFKNKPGSPRWDDHVKALSLAIDAGLKLKIAEPCAIHQVLMSRMWPEIAGRLRTINVRVGPDIKPSYQVVPEKLAAWMNMVTTMFQTKHDEIRAQSAKARIAQIWQTHVEFEHIHPFQDGNGRTGRILMVNHALLLGVKPPLVMYHDRFEYYRRFD